MNLMSGISVDALELTSEKVIIMTVDPDMVDSCKAYSAYEMLHKLFPNNTVIGLVAGTKLDFADTDYLKELRKRIDKELAARSG